VIVYSNTNIRPVFIRFLSIFRPVLVRFSVFFFFLFKFNCVHHFDNKNKALENYLLVYNFNKIDEENDEEILKEILKENFKRKF
jgi:hypothetical protein